VFRIGHLGDLNEGMCLTAISIAELCLAGNAGAQVRFGSGVAAAQEVYAEPARAVRAPPAPPNVSPPNKHPSGR
jgi:alanine-glyoxylate transaminase / serine-glyoxylate transaminase / serine-pyruvate transaminase